MLDEFVIFCKSLQSDMIKVETGLFWNIDGGSYKYK